MGGFVSAEDKCDGCKVHTGYDRNFAALAPYFQTSNNLVDGTEDLAVVGASAGAVLAIFGAIELEGEDVPIKAVQTLGMPRPGNKAFSSYVTDLADFTTFSLTYYRDPMPHIPPTILGYRQATSNYAWVYRPVAYQGTDSLQGLRGSSRAPACRWTTTLPTRSSSSASRITLDTLRPRQSWRMLAPSTTHSLLAVSTRRDP